MGHLYLFILLGAYLSTIFCQILGQSRSSQPGSIDNVFEWNLSRVTYLCLLLFRELKLTAIIYFNNSRLFYTCVAISGRKRALDLNFVLRNYHVLFFSNYVLASFIESRHARCCFVIPFPVLIILLTMLWLWSFALVRCVSFLIEFAHVEIISWCRRTFKFKLWTTICPTPRMSLAAARSVIMWPAIQLHLKVVVLKISRLGSSYYSSRLALLDSLNPPFLVHPLAAIINL